MIMFPEAGQVSLRWTAGQVTLGDFGLGWVRSGFHPGMDPPGSTQNVKDSTFAPPRRLT